MRAPTLLVYGVACLAFLVTIPYTPYPGSVLVKALPILVLAGLARVSLEGRTRLFMTAALLLSACGDSLLELDMFTPGLGAFLLAQLCYAWFFFSQRRDLKTLPYGRLLIIVAIIPSVSIPVVAYAGNLLVPVTIYMSAIALMGISAALYRQPSNILFIGALLFIASDSMIGINRFVSPLPGASYAIMLTYYAAQLLILWGVMRAAQNTPNTGVIVR